MNTLTHINQLADERLKLWRIAGQQPLTPGQIKRVQEITDELYRLWDVHRREVASGRPIQQPNNLINIRKSYRAA